MELFVFVRQFVALQEQEFGAIQAQTAGAERMRFCHVFQRFGVGQQGDIDVVARARGLGAQPPQLALFLGQRAQALAVVAQMFGLGVDDHLARAGIDDQHIAIFDALHRLAHTDHQRQVQAARQDRAMRQRTAGRGDDADDPLRLQLRQLGRGDVVAHQDLAGHALQVGRALVQKNAWMRPIT